MSKAKELYRRIHDGLLTPLEACLRFPLAAHHWSNHEREALTLALASGRPLLVRGEAGSGKSQLARAVANVLEADLLVEVVHARFEASDLKYRLDLVKRLADAESRDPEAQKRIGDWSNYFDHGVYWQACDADKPVVLLIDEIDKADSDIPNALLDVLGNGSFDIPYLDKVKHINPDFPPLVIITTNEDRELPAAFVRRCVVLNQNPPGADEESFCAWLQQRGEAHSYLKVSGEAAREAALMVWEDRQFVVKEGFPPVGLAEYIDLLRALSDLAAGDAVAQLDWLYKLRGYALIKQRDLNQHRHQQGIVDGDAEID